MVKLIGVPYEGGENFLKGTTLAPSKIRWALESIEIYSIYQKDYMPEYTDLGDFIPGEKAHNEILKSIEEELLKVVDSPFGIIGGDHTITVPAIKALKRKIRDFYVIHLDAHLDMRDEYRGNGYSHASVLRRLIEEIGEERVISLGYRSIIPDDEYPPLYSRPFEVLEPLKAFLRELKPGKVYLTLDLDVLDPSEFPAVSNPEPGGISFRELVEAIKILRGRLVGFDLVEFNPAIFPGHYPAVTAAVLLRELLIALK